MILMSSVQKICLAIFSDLTEEMVGSLVLINLNQTQAMAQAVHGSAPDIKGKGIANPVGIMWSIVMLLELILTEKD